MVYRWLIRSHCEGNQIHIRAETTDLGAVDAIGTVNAKDDRVPSLKSVAGQLLRNRSQLAITEL